MNSPTKPKPDPIQKLPTLNIPGTFVLERCLGVGGQGKFNPLAKSSKA